MSLEQEFNRIRESHKEAVRARVARVCFSGSTGRVFPESTTQRIKTVLTHIDVDYLLGVKSQEDFKEWFEENLDSVFDVIPERSSQGKELHKGSRKWGYAAKILTLFLRDIVEHCRYFTNEQAKKARRWLYVPIDGIVMDKLRECGERIPFRKIKEVDTCEKFYSVQERLGKAADEIGVPRVWFDDNWGDR